jgi:predicted TIM-barrel fold metal-dependent hydrolase
MADDTKDKPVIAKPDRTIPGWINEFITIRIQPQRCIVDGHAHIENGSCAPLPPLWNKLPWLIRWMRLERGTIDVLGTIVFTKAGPLQILSTMEIGYRALKELDDMFGSKNITNSDLYLETDLFSLIVVMMMDMEYAHLGGFKESKDGNLAGLKGQTIYHEDEMPWYIYVRSNAKDPEIKGKKVQVPSENLKTFSKWDKQLNETISAMVLDPLRMMGMYHYEPRRWNYSGEEKVMSNFHSGPWDYPFEQIATSSRPGPFIGFKMYTSLGYKPLDGRLPYLKDFYARCAQEEIPILNHCSPPGGGMITHEMKFYKEADNFNDKDVKPLTYFSQNYVHPTKWGEVLEKFPNLKLCLAHFGGSLWEKDDSEVDPNGNWRAEILGLINNYDNVYTDISCWNLHGCNKNDFKNLLLQDPKLKERIIFGTDWYMTLIPSLIGAGTSYGSFCKGFWDFFMDENFKEGKELWQRITFINSFKFYGFDKEATIDNISNKLLMYGTDPKLLEKNRKIFHRLIKDFDKICNKIKSGQ